MNPNPFERSIRPPSLTLLVWLSIIAICLYMFVDLAEDIVDKEGFTWDRPVALEIHHFHLPWLDFVMEGITQTGTIGTVSVALGAAIWYWHRKHRFTAVTLLGSLGGAMALNTVLKIIFMRARPHIFPALMIETDYSFPSGHTIASVVVYGFLAVMLWRSRHYGWTVFAGLWVLLVAISRVYLGVHYPSDVLASLTLGTIWLITTFLIYDKYNQPQEPLYSAASIEALSQLAIKQGLPSESIERLIADSEPDLDL